MSHVFNGSCLNCCPDLVGIQLYRCHASLTPRVNDYAGFLAAGNPRRSIKTFAKTVEPGYPYADLRTRAAQSCAAPVSADVAPDGDERQLV